PKVVIRAELGGWTRDGIVRQAAFKGFDEGGKPPTQVVRERPVEARETVEAVEASLPDEEQDSPMPTKAKRGSAASRRDGVRGAVSGRPSATPSTASARAGRRGRHREAGAPAGDQHEFAWSATAEELAALDGMTKDGVWTVGGFELKLTNLDKVLFKPKAGDP